jgi:hypothetical protein
VPAGRALGGTLGAVFPGCALAVPGIATTRNAITTADLIALREYTHRASPHDGFSRVSARTHTRATRTLTFSPGSCLAARHDEDRVTQRYSRSRKYSLLLLAYSRNRDRNTNVGLCMVIEQKRAPSNSDEMLVEKMRQ